VRRDQRYRVLRMSQTSETDLSVDEQQYDDVDVDHDGAVLHDSIVGDGQHRFPSTTDHVEGLQC